MVPLLCEGRGAPVRRARVANLLQPRHLCRRLLELVLFALVEAALLLRHRLRQILVGRFNLFRDGACGPDIELQRSVWRDTTKSPTSPSLDGVASVTNIARREQRCKILNI